MIGPSFALLSADLAVALLVWWAPRDCSEGIRMGMVLLIVLILLLVGALPTWGHSRKWGYAPSGGLGLVVVILLVLVLMGYVPHRF